MIYLVTFSTPLYRKASRNLENSAKLTGEVDYVYNLNVFDLFRNSQYWKNPDIFSRDTGFGLWAWKPLLIREILGKIDDGDYLFYVDARTVFVDSIRALINCIDLRDDIILFSASPHKNGQYVKQEAFEYLNLGDEVKHEFQCNAAYIGLKKSKKSIEFMDQYLNACLDEKIISDSYFSSSKNSEEFITHKFDQSVLSLLAVKNNTRSYQSPDQFGVFNVDTIPTKEIFRSKLQITPSLTDRLNEKIIVALKKVSFRILSFYSLLFK